MYALRPLKLVFDMVLRKLPGLIFDEELHNTADFFVDVKIPIAEQLRK